MEIKILSAPAQMTAKFDYQISQEKLKIVACRFDFGQKATPSPVQLRFAIPASPVYSHWTPAVYFNRGIDEGWETDDGNPGFVACGDWEPSTAKIPNMADLVKRLHEIGMKVILWFSVPFIGLHSKNFERFQGMLLNNAPTSPLINAYYLDPRYKEVRDFLTVKKSTSATSRSSRFPFLWPGWLSFPNKITAEKKDLLFSAVSF